MYVHRNTEARSCNRSYNGKEISITYSECVFVALGIHHVMHMRRIVICGLSGSTIFFPHYLINERLRWSRGSVLAFSTQVRGFKPGRSRRIFWGEKILSTPSFGGEVKPTVPCRRFAACKRSLNLRGIRNLVQNYRTSFSPTVPPFAARISRVVADVPAPGGESGNV